MIALLHLLKAHSLLPRKPNLMLKKLIAGISLALLQSFASPCSVLALPIWDLAADWSDSTNPNGVWSYNEGSNSLAHVSDWQPGAFSTPQPAWAPSGGSNPFLPAWFMVNGTPTFASDIQAGDIVVHSTDDFNGVGSGSANVTWTSPISGGVDISGFAWAGREIGRSNSWALLLNGTPLTSGSVGSGDAYDRSNPFLFSSGSGGSAALDNVSVMLGDVLTLLVTKSSSAGDFVGVALTVMQVPEPSTAVLLAPLAAAAFLLRTRLRSRQ